MMKKRFRFLAILLYLLPLAGVAQDFSLYQKRWLVQGGDTLPYRVLLPVNFDSAKAYPLMMFLHGAGERGNDNEKQLTHGARLFLRTDVREQFPAIVVFPQCSRNDYWSHVLRHHDDINNRSFFFLPDGNATRSMELLQLLVGFILEEYPVDKDRLYLGGLSMGAMGTFELARRKPGMFAAAVAICGGAHPATAAALNSTRWWIFHGEKDDVVPPHFSRSMATALKKAGANVKATFYPEANHNSWDAAFAEKDLLPWLFAQKKRPAKSGRLK